MLRAAAVLSAMALLGLAPASQAAPTDGNEWASWGEFGRTSSRSRPRPDEKFTIKVEVRSTTGEWRFTLENGAKVTSSACPAAGRDMLTVETSVVLPHFDTKAPAPVFSDSSFVKGPVRRSDGRHAIVELRGEPELAGLGSWVQRMRKILTACAG